jgi:hypothetical protein
MNAIEMIGIVLTELTKTVNLRHFLVPREVVPRIMTSRMLAFDCDDNPVIDHFRSGLTASAKRRNFTQPPSE